MAENNEELRTMQEEAIRRVREMQRRSQSYIGQPESPAELSPPDEKKAAPQNTGLPLLSDLAGLRIDEEKALIGLLMYVLYKNNADMKLILALGYLLL